MLCLRTRCWAGTFRALNSNIWCATVSSPVGAGHKVQGKVRGVTPGNLAGCLLLGPSIPPLMLSKHLASACQTCVRQMRMISVRKQMLGDDSQGLTYVGASRRISLLGVGYSAQDTGKPIKGRELQKKKIYFKSPYCCG